MDIVEIIKELEKFSNVILALNTPVDETQVVEFEKSFNLVLPADYRFLLKMYNGVTLDGTQVYGINEAANVFSLKDCYIGEHYEVSNPMPLYLVPFSPDGGGNHYCFDTRTNNSDSCNIVFWQHDYPYSEDNLPEITNTSFAGWIKEVMIDWTLEDYDYDGTEK
jgi:cell wall assembly regulator SMI1